jgi:hypothetical protein
MLRHLARKVRRVVGASYAFVDSGLRVCAYGTRTIDHTVGTMRRQNLVRCLPFLNPLFECAHRVKCVRSLSAAAMSHAGKHEQVDRITCFLAHRFQKTLVIVNGVERRDILVAPP